MISPASNPTLREAPVLHVDLDAFFASVEILDDPKLRGKAVAVGGGGDRGVIASASYEARRHGITSAMPSLVARRLCPDLIILPGRFDRYEFYSQKFHSIISDITPAYEPLGLDEVFCDLSSLRRLDAEPMTVARVIHSRLRDEQGLNCGIGVAKNKLFAKFGSKRAKPKVEKGVLVPGPEVLWVDSRLERHLLDTLPVRALWGVGPATSKKLEGLGLRYVRDLVAVDPTYLAAHLGRSAATTLIGFSKGDDPRPVSVDRVTKSVGHEETFAVSVVEPDELRRHCRRHSAVVARTLRSNSTVARTISVVIKFDDMTSMRRSQTVNFGLDDEEAIEAIALALMDSVSLRGAVRLFGVTASNLSERGGASVQMSFNVDTEASVADFSRVIQADRSALRDAIDEIRARYGRSAVGRGLDIDKGEIRVERQRGSHAFGPQAEGVNDSQ